MPNIFRDTADFLEALPPKKRYSLYAGVLICVVLITLFFAFEKPILSALGPVAKNLRNLPYGYVYVITAVILTNFPPIPGYSTVLITSGFIYGFPKGVLPSAVGALIGSVLCFVLFRHACQMYTEKLLNKDRRFAALPVAIHNEGFKIIFLIRLSPFPVTLSNAFFASIHSVSFWQFALATFLTLPKQLIHIFIGSRFADLTDAENPDNTSRLINWLSITIGILLFAIAAWYLHYKTMQIARNAAGKARMIESTDQDDEERGINISNDIDVTGLVGLDEHGVGTSLGGYNSRQQEIAMTQVQKH